MSPVLAALDLVTLDEVRDVALARLDPRVGDFLEGGAGDEVTLQQNRSAFRRWGLRPRVMSGLEPPGTATTFLGVPLSLPVLTAPFGADVLFHPDGHLAVARANAAAGTASIVPEAGSHSAEAVAAAAPTGAAFGQLHPMGEEATFLRMLRRYEDAGYRGIVVTCDCPTAGWRDRNLRNRFMPDARVLGGNYPPGAEVSMEAAFGQLFVHDEPVWSWDRLGNLMSRSALPWVAKGILTPEDAVAAVAAGAGAVLVSNHGGRQLDGVQASVDALPAVRAAVGPEVGIALDSGVRRGSDLVKALALGADVVVLGRLAAYGLAAGGEAGVARVLELLRQEVVSVLALLGRGSAADLDSTCLLRLGGDA